MGQNKEGGSRPVIASNRVEAIVASVLLLIGAVVVYNSVQLGARWTSDGPGSGYFPFYIGLMLCLSGAVTLYQALFGKLKNTQAFVDREQLKRVMAVLIPAGFYVLAIQFLGVYLASTLYIALFMRVLGRYSWINSIVAAVAVNAVFFLMFEVWFKVPLYKGIYEPLSFLGY
ncbi:MAG: tripartite tricarboxylate transporter TctB family protein [Betaproteobacteria bacterium]|nr:tripartite tricarboxylate transporter TctB family protein [Betaproteobacteria bacterium]